MIDSAAVVPGWPWIVDAGRRKCDRHSDGEGTDGEAVGLWPIKRVVIRRREARSAECEGRGISHPTAQAPWHFLNFLPDPHQHGSLRPSCSVSSTRRCCTAAGSYSSSLAASSPPAAPAIALAPMAAPEEYDTRAAPAVDDPPGV